MKKSFFVVLFMCIGILRGYAATKCVELNPMTMACTGWANDEYSFDWSQKVSLSGTSYMIHGVSACVDLAGVGPDEAFDTLPNYQGARCFCKLVSPAVSRWVMYQEMDDTERCLSVCNKFCAEAICAGESFAVEMLDVLID